MNLRGNTSNRAETPTIFDCPDSAYKQKVINQKQIHLTLLKYVSLFQYLLGKHEMLPFAVYQFKYSNAILLIYGMKVASTAEKKH